MTTKNGKTGYTQAAKRANTFRTLASHWVKNHRPDVAKVIREEVDKACPAKQAVYRVTLPKSLENLK